MRENSQNKGGVKKRLTNSENTKLMDNIVITLCNPKISPLIHKRDNMPRMPVTTTASQGRNCCREDCLNRRINDKLVGCATMLDVSMAAWPAESPSSNIIPAHAGGDNAKPNNDSVTTVKTSVAQAVNRIVSASGSER